MSSPNCRRLLVALLFGAALFGARVAAQVAPVRPVVVADLADTIHPITAEYVIESLADAEAQGASLFILRIDTPGGLDTSMRDIIQAFRASPVPVCLYVGPGGAQAASAGFFMAMAADYVAMAPGTNTGAASPVAVGGATPDETMQRKIMQNAEAYMRSLAEARGRPADLAVEAVSTGRSFAASEAVELGLADFIAADVDAVVAALEGRTLDKGGATLTLTVADAERVQVEMSLRQRLLAILVNPNIAYILMLLGIVGIYFELSTPGAIFPGVLGAMSLVLAFVAFQYLPISIAGLALIGLAVLFFLLEIWVTSYGLLTVAGLVAFVIGSLMLVPGPIPEMRLQSGVVLPVAFTILAIAGSLVWLVLRTHRGRVQTGPAGLVHRVGRAVDDIGPSGQGNVFVHGELWKARSDLPVRAGEPVEILGFENGMVIRVRPAAGDQGS